MQFGQFDRARGRSSVVAVPLLISAFLIGGCSDRSARSAEDSTVTSSTDNSGGETKDADSPPADPTQTSTSVAGPSAAQAKTESATIGGDGSEIELRQISALEIEEAKLPGELGCSFSTSEASLILIAMGNVASRDAAQGIVKVGSYVERLSAPGGFDAMLKGVTFSGAGKTVRIKLTGPAVGGGESPARLATLTYDRADGARRTFTGRWNCGP